MGSSATVTPSLPPLPPGATLNTQPAQTPPPASPGTNSLPPLPPGATLSAPKVEPTAKDKAIAIGHGLTQDDPTVGMTTGMIKGGMQSISGIMDLVRGHFDHNESDVSDVLDYQKEHPGASDQEALDATQKGYRGKTGQKTRQDMKDAADWLHQHGETHGFFQGLGNVGESIAEFFTPEALGVLGKTAKSIEGAEAASKTMGIAERLRNSQRAAQILKEHPILAKAVAVGLRTMKAAAEAGGQTYVKTGGDTEQATEAAKTGAVVGAGVEGASSALRAGIEHLSPTVEDIGGTKVTRLASQKPYSSAAQQIAATAEHEPAIQKAQQAAGNEIIGNAAKGSAAKHLTEVNEGRTVEPRAATVPRAPYKFKIGGTGATETSEGTIAQQPRKVQTGTRAVEGKGPSERQTFTEPGTGEQRTVDINQGEPDAPGSHRSPTFRLSEESKPGSVPKRDIVGGGADLTTEDPTIAREHIRTLSDAIDSPDVTPTQKRSLIEQRTEMQRQMNEYHDQRAEQDYSPYKDQPTFEPVDVQKEVAKVGSYEDAADSLENAAKPVYNRLDDLTGGRFSELRDANKRAWKSVQNGGGDKAAKTLKRTQDRMDAMLSGRDGEVGDTVSKTDLSYANEAWKKAQILRDVHSHIEGAYDSAIGASGRANAYRGFNGNRLRTSLKQLSDAYGERTLNRVIGTDQYNNLVKLADITRTTADRVRFGGGVNEVARFIAKNEGKIASTVAAAGGGAGYLVGGPHGAAIGSTAVEATYLATRRVMRAIATNPKIGKNFTFAIESGARPEYYAPMIAAQISKQEEKKDAAEQ